MAILIGGITGGSESLNLGRETAFLYSFFKFKEFLLKLLEEFSSYRLTLAFI